jgi:hypothetical protein
MGINEWLHYEFYSLMLLYQAKDFQPRVELSPVALQGFSYSRVEISTRVNSALGWTFFVM